MPLRDVTTSGVSVDGTTAFTGDLSGNVDAVDVVNEVRGVDDDRTLVRGSTRWTACCARRRPIGDGKVVVTAINQTTRRRRDRRARRGDRGGTVEPCGQRQSTQATPVTIDGDRVLVGFGEPSGGGVLTAFSLGDGLTLWSTRFSSQFFVLTDILVSDGYALAVAAHIGLETGLYRVRLSDGAQLHAVELRRGTACGAIEFDTSGVLSSPVVIGNTVVLGLDDGRMAAIDTASGLLVWKVDVGDAPIRGLAAGDGVIIASVGSARRRPGGPRNRLGGRAPCRGVELQAELGRDARELRHRVRRVSGVAAASSGSSPTAGSGERAASRPDDDPDERTTTTTPHGEEPS